MKYLFFMVVDTPIVLDTKLPIFLYRSLLFLRSLNAPEDLVQRLKKEKNDRGKIKEIAHEDLVQRLTKVRREKI